MSLLPLFRRWVLAPATLASVIAYGKMTFGFQPPGGPPSGKPAATSAQPAAKPPASPSLPSVAERPGQPADDTAAPEPILSFEPTANASNVSRVTPGLDVAGGERRLSFNFRYAPWSDVLERFAELAGLTLDLHDVPPGTFNYYDTGTYTPAEALDILNGYLLQKGYVLVRRNQFLVVLNIDNGIPPNLVPNVDVDELPRRGKNELLSVVIPLEGIEAETAGKEVEALLGPQGKVVALTASNSVVVTDIGSNLQRILKLLQNVSAKDPGAPTFRAFALEHIPVTEAERIVRSLLGLSQSVPNVSASTVGFGGFGFGSFGGGDPRFRFGSSESRGSSSSSSGSSRPPSSSRSGSALSSTTQVASDPRTNTLLVTATAAELRLIEETVRAIDVAEATGGNFATADVPHLRVYTLTSSDPREVTKTLDAILPGVVVNEDGRNNKVHIVATAAQHREVEQLIRQLDGGGGAQSVAVFSLAMLDPVAVTGTLRSLFAGEGNQAPTIEADALGQRVMVRGTADQITQVKTLLAQLGEDGTGMARDDPRWRGPVRTVPLGGRNPEEFLKLLERVWETSRPNPIRVVIPPRAGPIREQRVPSRPPAETIEPAPPAEPPRRSQSSDAPTDARERLDDIEARAAVRRTVFTVALANAANDGASAGEPDNAGEASDAVEEPQSAPAHPSKPEVTVMLSGGDLVISSTDLEALDELQELIETLARAIPVQTQWTVFYLRSADATEAAAMLEQLFPSSSVSLMAGSSDNSLMGGLTSGIASLGRGLAEMTGLSNLASGPQTLRIIPETRSNSLFVMGPADVVKDVEEVLRILDASELPETLRDRVPRMITVEHADVDDVAAIVRDVYRDYLESGQLGGGNRNVNPLALLMGAQGGGGDGGQRRGGRYPEVRLTLGVDRRTNQLIVSAEDSLFRQIEALVRSLDAAAEAAQQTVRVVKLEHTRAAVVQETLASMIPKVTVSVTRSGAEGRGPAAPAAAPQPTQPQPGEEEIRRLFEQRIREQLLRGGLGGAGGDGRTIPGAGGGGGPPGGRTDERGSGGSSGRRGGFGRN